jgi:molecular chaperone GrpE
VTRKPHKEKPSARKAGSESREAKTEDPLVPAEQIVPEGEGEEQASDAETLQGEIALLEGQLQDMRDRYVRAVADLDNARKRARKEMAEAQVHAVSGVMLGLLTIVDSFERALETAKPGVDATAETKAVYEGMRLIYRQLMDMLTRRGVRPIEALGQPFDPSVHEAVVQVPMSEDQEEGAVALELEKGYYFGERVLRPSKVGVSVSEAEQGSAREP